MPGAGDLAVCAFCRRQPPEDPWRPFCSERCKLQDLAKWTDEAYRVSRETPDDDLEPDAGPDDA